MKITEKNYEKYFDREFFESSFKIFHELMPNKIREILLVSSPYDAFILEEDGRLAERIVNEYKGLNLSSPPKLTWVSSSEEALVLLSKKNFDLAITMPRYDDPDPYYLGNKLKKNHPELPVLVLAHDTVPLAKKDINFSSSVNNSFVWNGNTDLLLAIIKSVEDEMNVSSDTKKAKVRVIIFVEDSPTYLSSLLPVLYKEIVLQTQAVIEESLNEEERLLRMRARPKIILAKSYEEAEHKFRLYKNYILGIISDTNFKIKNKEANNAGFQLNELIRKEAPEKPFLLLSNEETNREKAKKKSILFVNKNAPNLHSEIRRFFTKNLAFGEFIFRYPDGKEITRASNLREMEKLLPSIPNESFQFHANGNHFSTWLIARSEVVLASIIRSLSLSDFDTVEGAKRIMIYCLNRRRYGHQKGIVTDFSFTNFDPDTDFIKIGKGSLGGKARGLAFITPLLQKNKNIHKKYERIKIKTPKTLVISTEYFDIFLDNNNLKNICDKKLNDSNIIDLFIKAKLPLNLEKNLKHYIEQIKYPLAIRSSSLFEDSHTHPFAGIYNTYIIPNNIPETTKRLQQLLEAVKKVYASTYLQASKNLSKSISQRIEEEKMAVIIQQAVGCKYGEYFFPAISGVAQSYNFYPISRMKPEEGIANIALGFGKTVVEGENSLRFSPEHPQIMPNFTTVDDILKNSQKNLFALNMFSKKNISPATKQYLQKIEIEEIFNEVSKGKELRELFSSYSVHDHRITDAYNSKNLNIITFANILKYNEFPLPEILKDILHICRTAMGSPVEIEFAINLKKQTIPEFILLQIRPMTVQKSNTKTEITPKDIKEAFCYSEQSMGNGIISDISNIVLISQTDFVTNDSNKIASEISKINHKLIKENKRYLLIGPGRWGSSDKHLGIPVKWSDISGVKAIVELNTETVNTEPSQGSHFFHNICSMGIAYITVSANQNSFINLKKISTKATLKEYKYLQHFQLNKPLKIKLNGRNSQAAIIV